MLNDGIGEHDVVLVIANFRKVTGVSMNHPNTTLFLPFIRMVRVQIHTGNFCVCPIYLTFPHLPEIIRPADIKQRTFAFVFQRARN